MTGASRRLASLVDRYGETFTVGITAHRGIFSNVTVGTDRSYMPASDVDAAGIPLWTCLVKSDDTTAIDDQVNWNSLLFSVKRILQARYMGELAGKMLVLGLYTFVEIGEG